jgi:Cupin domain
VHRSYDEAWFIIEGTMEFVLDGQRERQGAGAFVFVPRGVVHSFANPGPAEARMLVIGSGPAQTMVEEVGRLSEAGRLSPDTIMEVYRRHDSALARGGESGLLVRALSVKRDNAGVPCPGLCWPARAVSAGNVGGVRQPAAIDPGAARSTRVSRDAVRGAPDRHPAWSAGGRQRRCRDLTRGEGP